MTNLLLILYTFLLGNSLLLRSNIPSVQRSIQPYNLYNISVASSQSMSLRSYHKRPSYDDLWLYII